MLTPEYLQRCSEGAEHIAAQLHTNLLKQITRRIQARQAKGYDYILTSTDKWAIESLMDARYLREDLMREIAQANNLQAQEMRDAFIDAGVKTTQYDDRIYKAAGIEATDFSRSPYYQRIVQREYEATMGTWQNTTRTTADAAQQTFIQTMDAIHHEVLSGSASYTQAYTNAINKLAQDGLSITYPSGHVDTIEVATLRCVRTGVSQASAEIGLARMDEYGIDLVVVSSHMGARPSHALWQGKIYSRSGKSRKYPEFERSTGYGTGEGLCGWNCRHNFSPYYEGMDNPFEEYDTEENAKQYEKEQRQRAMERAIRKSKREVDVLSDAVEHAQDGESTDTLTNMRARAQVRLKAQNKAYYAYCEDEGLRPLRERLKIGRKGMDNMMDITPVTVTVPEVPQPAPVVQTLADKIRSIRERVKAKGMATDADLHEAGRFVKEEVQKKYVEREEIREKIRLLIDERSDYELRVQELSDKIQDIIDSKSGGEYDPFQLLTELGENPEIDALQSQIDAILGDEHYKDLCSRIDELKMRVSDTAHSHANTLRDVLSQFREMGNEAVKLGVKSKTDTAKVLEDALSYYPKDWVQYAIDSGGIKVRHVSRGYCDTFDNLICLSGMGDEDTFTTAIHELGHYFETKASISSKFVPFDPSKTWWKPYMRDNYGDAESYILNAEREFYKRRTQGESLEWLGSGYDKKEVTRKDKFLHPYMGKDYNGDAFELVSMGFQYAYTDPERLARDPDMEEWIYGILSLF